VSISLKVIARFPSKCDVPKLYMLSTKAGYPLKIKKKEAVLK
jgi:hypothetical protein